MSTHVQFDGYRIPYLGRIHYSNRRWKLCPTTCGKPFLAFPYPEQRKQTLFDLINRIKDFLAEQQQSNMLQLQKQQQNQIQHRWFRTYCIYSTRKHRYWWDYLQHHCGHRANCLWSTTARTRTLNDQYTTKNEWTTTHVTLWWSTFKSFEFPSELRQS